MSGAGSDGYRIHARGMDSEPGKPDRTGDDVGALREAMEGDFAAARQAEAKRRKPRCTPRARTTA